MRFKLYLSNWTPNCFENHSVARSKVAIMIPGLYSIFFFQICGMCQVFAQQVTSFCCSTSACLTSRKTPKQWRKMFFYLLESPTVNCYILYKKAYTKAEARPLTSSMMIDDLVHKHLESSNRPTVGHPRLWPTPIRLRKKLHLFNQCTTNCNCVVCSGETRHTTSYYCTTCPEEPALY